MWTILSHARLMNRNSNSLRTQSTPGLSQPGFGPSAEGEDDDDEPGFGLPEPEGDLEGVYGSANGRCCSLPPLFLAFNPRFHVSRTCDDEPFSAVTPEWKSHKVKSEAGWLTLFSPLIK